MILGVCVHHELVIIHDLKDFIFRQATSFFNNNLTTLRQSYIQTVFLRTYIESQLTSERS